HRSVTAVGARQLIPTATSCPGTALLKQEEATVLKSLPSTIDFPSFLHEKDNQALMSGNSLMSSTSASASIWQGIVSRAMKSTPASMRVWMRGLCHFFKNSFDILEAYSPVYSDPSCKEAP
ncbi:hypothetical protein G9C98_006900, partial [Cotesia typhae]